MEILEKLRSVGHREAIEVLESRPPPELVASVDIVRYDHLGRQVCACPVGKAPPSWLRLTDSERTSLVEPPPPLPQGHMHAGRGGFTPEGVVMGGFTIGHVDQWD